MATATDFWNEVERRITQAIDARLSGLETSEGTSAPPPAAGGLPIHNNAHHEPPLALQSDLESLTFLDLTDVIAPTGYLGQALKVPRVDAGEAGLEFHALTAADVGADPTGAAADAIAAHLLAADPHPQYALVGHIQTVPTGGTGLTGIAVDNLIYSSALDTFTATPITAFGRSLIDDADAAAGRATLGAIGGTGTASRFAYWSGTNTVAAISEISWDSVNGRLGFNTTSPTAAMDVRYPVDKTSIAATIALFDTTAYAAGVGGMFNLGGKWNSAGQTTSFAAVQGVKENGTDGNYAGALVFYTRQDGTGGWDVAGQEKARLTSLGSLVLGTAAIATTATDGFLYIPGGAGAPTGVPTAFTGRVPLYYDTTNNRFYAYNGGWKSVALA